MPDRHGPYRNIRFLLELDGIAQGGFATCHIPECRTDVIRYREGNDPPTSRKLAGLNRFGRLVLDSGVTDSMELYEWHELVTQGQVDEARRDAAVVLLDREGNTAARWALDEAWPARYDAPRLDARGEDVAIETLEIVCEGLERVNDGSSTDGGAAEPADEEPAQGADTHDRPTFDVDDVKRGRQTDVEKQRK